LVNSSNGQIVKTAEIVQVVQIVEVVNGERYKMLLVIRYTQETSLLAAAL
jgi:hypothetical protein